MCMLYVFIYLSTYLPTYLVRVLVDSLYISIPNPLFGVDYWIRWPATISAHVMSHLPAIFEPQPSRKTCHGPVMAQSWPSISSIFASNIIQLGHSSHSIAESCGHLGMISL